MRIDPEIEDAAMEAARREGKEKDYEYWRRLHLTTLERQKERESNWELDKILLWIAGVGIALLFLFKGILRW
jgi:hypothetical protein